MEPGAVVPPPYVAGPLRLEPFRAQMLSPARIGDPASARALARPYREGASRLSRWKQQGNLWHDPDPALYLHEYTSAGITIRGLVGLIDVSRRARNPHERAILPHEGIHPAQADDLAARMDEMQLNPAPILLVHTAVDALRALTRETLSQPSTRRFTDRAEQQHRIWAIREPDLIDAVNRSLADAQALIADGHHRYAAYLRLHQRRPEGPTRFGLVMLVDQGDTPLFLGAIHRVLAGSSVDDVAKAARSLGFQTSEQAEREAISSLAPRSFVATDGERWLVVELGADGERGPDEPLPIEILHDAVIPALPHGPRRITFHHQVRRALSQASPELGVAILLPAPDVSAVSAAAAKDRQLPQKATSFQPKPSLGSLMRSLRDEPGHGERGRDE